MLAKLTWTEIKLGLREPTVAVFALAFPLILLYLLLNSFGTLPDPDFGGSARPTGTCPRTWPARSPPPG